MLVAMDYVLQLLDAQSRHYSRFTGESGCQELACIAQELACIAASDDCV
jgi:hypothetical protein